MVTQVSVRILAVLGRGKYTRWAEQLPLASLEAILCAAIHRGAGGRRPVGVIPRCQESHSAHAVASA